MRYNFVTVYDSDLPDSDSQHAYASRCKAECLFPSYDGHWISLSVRAIREQRIPAAYAYFLDDRYVGKTKGFASAVEAVVAAYENHINVGKTLGVIA